MSFHRSCCCKEDCFPYGTAVSFLDLYRDTLGDPPCGDCPIEGGCTGEMLAEGVEILEGQIDCHCEQYWEGEWVPVSCPHLPVGENCEYWPGPGTFDFYHCSNSCVTTFPDECEANADGLPLCTEDCTCSVPYRLICNQNANDCHAGGINGKCCSRLHVYYGAYHDGEKYWLSDNPMEYFPGDEDTEGVNCKRQCGAVTLSTAPQCQGHGLYHCPDLAPDDMYCSPVGCCEENLDNCGNCPFCADPSDAPFCCQSSPDDICEFYGQDQDDQNYIDTWAEWCVHQHGTACLLDYEPYYWKFCGVGGWGASPGDVHISRMYTIDDEEESPTYGQNIPCNNQQGCPNNALYDLYNITNGGEIEPFVPHVLIIYAEHIRVGSVEESKSSYTVKGWWVSCTSQTNVWDLPIEGNSPDCHCDDSSTAQVRACCTEKGGETFCQDIAELDCLDQGGNWQSSNICSDNPC